MESYIIRVYRKGRDTSEELAGLVEAVETSEKTPFKTFSGLVSAIRHSMNKENTKTAIAARPRIYAVPNHHIKKQAG